MVKFQALNDQSVAQEMLFVGLSQDAQALFVDLCRLDGGRLIIHLLYSFSTTWRTLDDIAYHIAQPVESVEQDLEVLEQLGLVQTTRVPNVALYGLTTNPRRLQLVREICSWQSRWETRIKQIQHQLWGGFSSSSPSVTWQAIVPRLGPPTHELIGTVGNPR